MMSPYQITLFYSVGSTVMHPDNGVLISDKNKGAGKPQKDMEETEMHTARCKKLI